MNTPDRYGRVWNLSPDELCPECGQPDNCNDCNHAPLSDEDYAFLQNDTHPPFCPAFIGPSRTPCPKEWGHDNGIHMDREV